MVYVAVLAGTIAGSISDPIFILGMLLATVIGFSRGGSLPLVGAALAFAIVRTLISMNNRSQLGLEPAVNVFVPLSALIAFGLVWAVAFGLSKVFLRRQ